jgi:hypothetical protein
MREPGQVVRYEAGDFKGGHRYGSARGPRHGARAGHRSGYDMPEEVIVFAREAADVERFGEESSPPVAAAAERALEPARIEVGA